LRIELKLLAYQEQAAIRAQQDIIDKSQPGSEAAKNAKTTIDQINAQHGRNVEIVNQQNESPLDAFGRELHTTAANIKDDFQSIEVEGISR